MLTKKKMISATMAALTGLLLATTAAASQPGAYAGLQLGWGDTHQNSLKDIRDTLNTDLDNTHSSISDTGLAGRLFSGYQFNQYFAAEMGFAKFSNATGKYNGNSNGAVFDNTYAVNMKGNVTVNSFAADLVGKAILPLQYGFSLYAKLGAAYLMNTAKADVTVNGTITDTMFNETMTTTDQFTDHDFASKLLPTYGLGVSYDVSQKVSADLSWSRIQKTGNSDLINNVDFIGLGFTYHLG